MSETCIECGRSVAIGSGRFINRIPAWTDDAEGFMCVDCQALECDRCGESTLDWTFTDSGEICCGDCLRPEEVER